MRGSRRILAAFAMLACGRGEEALLHDSAATGTAVTAAVPSQIVVTAAPDSTVVLSEGVLSDADDTLATQHSTHDAPRPIAPPTCLPAGLALCLADTAKVAFGSDVPDGGMPTLQTTTWLLLASAQDSMQLFVVSSRRGYLEMNKASASGFVKEHSRGVDASWLRFRFPRAGAYVLEASIESGSHIPYELRVIPAVATGASRAIGAAATLTLASKQRGAITIAPASMARSLDGAARKHFEVPAGSYRVLLVRDTIYVVCQSPCVRRDTVVLRPGDRVSVMDFRR